VIILRTFAIKIDVIAKFKENGDVDPIRFRVDRKDGSQAVVNIDRVIERKHEKIAGCPTILFSCEAEGKSCELKFWQEDCKWMLFRA
jgi:hypothetical protein